MTKPLAIVRKQSRFPSCLPFHPVLIGCEPHQDEYDPSCDRALLLTARIRMNRVALPWFIEMADPPGGSPYTNDDQNHAGQPVEDALIDGAFRGMSLGSHSDSLALTLLRAAQSALSKILDIVGFDVYYSGHNILDTPGNP